jgi:tetratricopeptide (TPR) repeat protein
MWNSQGKDATPRATWCEWDPALTERRGKLNWPFNLTIFAVFCEEENERFATDEEIEKASVFQEQLRGRLGPDDNALQVGRIWYKNVVQLDFRVRDPELANGNLQEIIKNKDHVFPFEYRMFPDGPWKAPKGYWNGDHIARIQAAARQAEAEASGAPVEAAAPTSKKARGKDDLPTVLSKFETAQGEERIPLWVRKAELLAGDPAQLVACEELLQAGLREYPDSVDIMRILSVVLIRLKKFDETRTLLHRAIELEELRAHLHFNLACNEALAGKPDEAMKALKNAFLLNPMLKLDAAKDTDFTSLRERDEFQKLTDLSKLGLTIGSRAKPNKHRHSLLVAMPAQIDPVERGRLYEDPLQALLAEKKAGEVLGGNSRLPLGGAEPMTMIEIGTDDLDATTAALREFFANVTPPPGTVFYPGARIGEPLDPSKAVSL